MTKVCLVSGLPGTGKTTLCEKLATEHPMYYEHVAFGRLILDQVRKEKDSVNERQLRERAAELVTPATLNLATAALYEAVDRGISQSVHQWVLVDSHAVSQTPFGFIATPDGNDYFSKIRYSAILHLFADPELILGRSSPEKTGRQARSASNLIQHEGILNAVTIVYSSICACPAYFLNANLPELAVASAAHELLSSTSK